MRKRNCEPPQIPGPMRFDRESERSFHKRQDKFIKELLRLRLSMGIL